MPPYFSIEAEWNSKKKNNSLQRTLYESILVNGFEFESVYEWNCVSNLTLDEIIEWNQKRLNDNFQLGYDENVSNDYKQIILSHKSFDHIRIFIANYNNSICIIIPEDELISTDDGYFDNFKDLDAKKIDILINWCKSMWHSGLYLSIQTYGELGENTPYENLIQGNKPAVTPFAIINKETYSKIDTKEFHVSHTTDKTGYILKVNK